MTLHSPKNNALETWGAKLVDMRLGGTPFSAASLPREGLCDRDRKGQRLRTCTPPFSVVPLQALAFNGPTTSMLPLANALVLWRTYALPHMCMLISVYGVAAA